MLLNRSLRFDENSGQYYHYYTINIRFQNYRYLIKFNKIFLQKKKKKKKERKKTKENRSIH